MKKLLSILLLLGGMVLLSPQVASAHVAQRATSGGGCTSTAYLEACISENAFGYVVTDMYIKTVADCNITIGFYDYGLPEGNYLFQGCYGPGSHMVGPTELAFNGNLQSRVTDAQENIWSPTLYATYVSPYPHSNVYGGGCNGNGYISACISEGHLPGNSSSSAQYMLPDAYVYGSPCNITISLFMDGSFFASDYYAGCGFFHSGDHVDGPTIYPNPGQSWQTNAQETSNGVSYAEWSPIQHS